MTDWPPELVDKAYEALRRAPFDSRREVTDVLDAIRDDIVLKRDLECRACGEWFCALSYLT